MKIKMLESFSVAGWEHLQVLFFFIFLALHNGSTDFGNGWGCIISCTQGLISPEANGPIYCIRLLK